MTDSTLKVITNNVPRDVIEAHELTDVERAEFDYLPWAKIAAGEDSASFARYKGDLIDLGEFIVWSNPDSPMRSGNWDGFRSDSFFSGLLVRYVDNCERVIVARYYS